MRRPRRGLLRKAPADQVAVLLASRRGQLQLSASAYERTGKQANSAALRSPEKAPDAPGQLYNLESDPGETTNLYVEHPEIVKQLKTQLDEFVSSGRGVPSRNVPAQ